jgi:nitrite reductase (cytochrome c-552)
MTNPTEGSASGDRSGRSEPPRSTGQKRVAYVVIALAAALVTAACMYLWQNISQRQIEARETVFQIANLTEDTVDPVEWGKNFPRQYDSYIRTVDTERTRHGGSDAFQKLDEDPQWRTFFAGYAFGVDYREERGHAYMLLDQEETERVTKFRQYGACLQCHASVLPAYRFKGREAGVPDDQPEEQIQKGFEIVCGMPYDEAHNLVDDQGNRLINHPVTCLDCHDPKTMQLRVTRPGFLNGIRDLAKSDQDLAHLPSIGRWRDGSRAKDYDPNHDASRQEMRSLVCAQCHVEYYFKGENKVVTYPWSNGLRVENIEQYYEENPHTDWKHEVTGAAMLKAQHPEFEMWSQGIHARSGVSCADCHMPYKREGAIKISDHHVRSPLLNINRSCQTCHRFPETEILARAESIQDRTRKLMDRAEDANMALIDQIKSAQEAGVEADRLSDAQNLHRQAQWRLDFVSAENSMGFHASQEVARILGEAIDLARQGELAAVRAQAGLKPPKPIEPSGSDDPSAAPGAGVIPNRVD